MPLTLIKTKLFLPVSRPHLVQRARLLSRLDQLCQPNARLGLVLGPAGFGKTTLVAQWIGRLTWPVCWLSLDEGDNPLPRFVAYLAAALQKIAPDCAPAVQELAGLPNPDLGEIAALFANHLAEAARPFLLVLDDYHAIRSPAVHTLLQRLLEIQPPEMRLLLLTRQDPPLPLARQRAGGLLVEIRPDELRFTPQESLNFLNACMGLDLTLAQVAQLETRTEGWIAGLQMAALSLQSAADRPAFIDTFSGSHRYILDYLAEEVLQRQPPELQRFLLHTAVLSRFCAPLCAALLEISLAQAQTLLEHAERANLFIIPLDDERRWFRYHHLFADLLRARLLAQEPAPVALLHQRASAWFEQQGDPTAALEHALSAQDYERAVQLFEDYIVAKWRLTDLEFMTLIDRLPYPVLARRPALALQSAWLGVINGQLEKVQTLVSAAETRLAEVSAQPVPPPPDLPGLSAFAQILRAYLADFDNEAASLEIPFDQLKALIPAENTGMLNSVAVVLGTLFYMNGDFAGAQRQFIEAAERDKAVQGTNAVPISISRLVRLLQVSGRLREAVALSQENIAYIQQHGPRRFYVAGSLYTQLAEILREWGQYQQAGQLLQEGQRLNESWNVPQAECLGWKNQAVLQLSLGRLDQSQEYLDKALACTRRARVHPDVKLALSSLQVRLWIASAQVSALQTWLLEQAPLAGQPFTFRYEALRICQARALLALNRPAEALALLEPLAQAAAAAGRNGHLLEILILQSLALPLPEALTPLTRAVHLAEPQAYYSLFVEAGPALRPRLEALLPAMPEQRAYLLRLLGAEPSPLTPPEQKALPEPLSERELEVLRLVAAGLSNQQIADRLVISVRTVKKHVENINGKLGAGNRTQAVALARALALLPA
jgi:LuxR family maltose regulon positive regulatory protein